AFRDKSYVDTACWIAFAVGGLLLGALVVCLYPVGVFLLGAFAGLLLATQLQTSFGYAIAPAHENTVFIVLLVVCGLLCGALALWLQRPFLIIATSWSGAIAAVWGIGYFAGGYPNAANLQKHMSGDKWVYDVPNAWWGYLAGTVVLALIGMWVQFRYYPAQAQSHASREEPATYVAASTPVKGNPVRHPLRPTSRSTACKSFGVGPDIIAGAAISVGLALVFLGYKLIRPAMFLAAFAVGAVLSFVIFENAFRDKSYVDTACWIAFAVGGLLLGALVVCLYPVGVFLLGAFAGLLL
ncbi:hypothetical protein As57867_003881, partial [Aphanomyces stellatus]